jgi:hypothetical protein
MSCRCGIITLQVQACSPASNWSFYRKIPAKLQHWATKLLPFAGRLQLISSFRLIACLWLFLKYFLFKNILNNIFFIFFKKLFLISIYQNNIKI